MRDQFPPSKFEADTRLPALPGWTTSATAVPRFSAPTVTRLPHFSLPTPTREVIDIARLEACLREALQHFPYKWPCKVTRELNALTEFVTAERRWWAIEGRLVCWKDLPRYRLLLNFARARWVAFWSALGVEEILGQHSTVTLNPNPLDKGWDFTLSTPAGTIAFDEKTSCFPRAWHLSYDRTREDPVPLIKWFYREQSAARYGVQNRFFVVLHAADGRHGQLRSELSLIGQFLQEWLQKPEVLDVRLDSGQQVKAAIVFVTA